MTTMLDIKPLSAENLDDYLAFFERVEFKEHPHWSACYCYSFHFTGTSELWNKESNRSSVCDLVHGGKMTGYLAYQGNNPIGWCNVNNRLNFQRLIKYYDLMDPEHKHICSIVCFLVHPQYRRKGITQHMLNRIETDCRSRGDEIIEAYPTKRNLSHESQYMGSLEFYQKNGFDIAKEFEAYYLVRKNLT